MHWLLHEDEHDSSRSGAEGRNDPVLAVHSHHPDRFNQLLWCAIAFLTQENRVMGIHGTLIMDEKVCRHPW
jgi:hypothetical protein